MLSNVALCYVRPQVSSTCLHIRGPVLRAGVASRGSLLCFVNMEVLLLFAFSAIFIVYTNALPKSTSGGSGDGCYAGSKNTILGYHRGNKKDITNDGKIVNTGERKASIPKYQGTR